MTIEIYLPPLSEKSETVKSQPSIFVFAQQPTQQATDYRSDRSAWSATNGSPDSAASTEVPPRKG